MCSQGFPVFVKNVASLRKLSVEQQRKLYNIQVQILRHIPYWQKMKKKHNRTLTLQAEYTVRKGVGVMPAAEDRFMMAPRLLSTMPGITMLVI